MSEQPALLGSSRFVPKANLFLIAQVEMIFVGCDRVKITYLNLMVDLKTLVYIPCTKPLIFGESNLIFI
jgi:hypothetical protein